LETTWKTWIQMEDVIKSNVKEMEF
jgi:hypothetical protein